MEEIIFINSKNRLNPADSDSDFTVSIPLKNNYYTKIRLNDYSIPKTYYNVPDGNEFQLVEGGNSVAINCQPGVYNRTNFKDMLSATLTAQSPNNYTYTVKTSSDLTSNYGDDGKLTYEVTGNGGTQPAFVFTDSMYSQMGFNVNSSNIFTASKLKSVNIINLNNEDILFLKSDIIKENYIYNVITTTAAPFAYMSDRLINYVPRTFNRKKDNIYRFWLTNKNDEVIDLNGINMIFTLTVYYR